MRDDHGANNLDPEGVPIARESLHNDLMRWVRDELVRMPKPWQTLTEAQQADTIERLHKRAAEVTDAVVRIIATGGKPSLVATLESVTIKDKIKATLTISKGSSMREDLFESAGAQVLIVIPEAIARTHELRAEPQQPGLDIGGRPPEHETTTVNEATRRGDVAALCQNLADLLDAWAAQMIPKTLEEIIAEIDIDADRFIVDVGALIDGTVIDLETLRAYVESLREKPVALPAPGTIYRAFAVKPKSGTTRSLPAAGMWAVDAEEAWVLYGIQHPGYHTRADFYVEECDPSNFAAIGCINPSRVEPPVDESGAPAGADQAAPPKKTAPKKRGGSGKPGRKPRGPQ